MRVLCALLLLFCACAGAFWEEEQWWWDKLWEDEHAAEEPAEPEPAEPNGKKYSKMDFDARWQRGRLSFAGSGEDGLVSYPWQGQDDYHFQTLAAEVGLQFTDFNLTGSRLLERRQFPWQQARNYLTGENGLQVSFTTSLPVEAAWRLGQGFKTYPRESRYSSQSSSRGVELWGKGKAGRWQFKMQLEQAEKMFPLWPAQDYLRDSVAFAGSYKPRQGWKISLKGESWQREYPLKVLAATRKRQWELRLEGLARSWQTEVSHLWRLQRYPYQPAYDYLLGRSRVGLVRSFEGRRQFFVGYTDTRQAFFQRDEAFAERSLLFRWHEKLGQLELVLRCEVGERTDEPDPYLIQLELVPQGQ